MRCDGMGCHQKTKLGRGAGLLLPGQLLVRRSAGSTFQGPVRARFHRPIPPTHRAEAGEAGMENKQAAPGSWEEGPSASTYSHILVPATHQSTRPLPVDQRAAVRLRQTASPRGQYCPRKDNPATLTSPMPAAKPRAP